MKILQGGNPVGDMSSNDSTTNNERREQVLQKRRERREAVAESGANPKKTK